MKTTKLIEIDGNLAIPVEAMVDRLQKDWFADTGYALLLKVYDAGDADTVTAKKPHVQNLFEACYDAREMGQLPSDAEAVELPDGTIWAIDQ